MFYKLRRSQMPNYLARHSNPVEVAQCNALYELQLHFVVIKLVLCLNVESGVLRTTVVKSVFRFIQPEILMS
jgi:hypothetical protein